MIKTINLSESQSVELNSSAGWLYLYQEAFGHDILVELMPAIEAFVDAIMTGASAAAAETVEDAAVAALGAMDEDEVGNLMIKLSGMQTTTFLNVLWCLVKNNDEATPRPKEWINQFELIEFDRVVPSVMGLILSSMLSKKKYETIRNLVKGLRISTSNESQSQESNAD